MNEQATAGWCPPHDKARKLGVCREDMLRAVTIAQNVKDTPARAVLDLARRHLETGTEPAVPGHPPTQQAGGCCGSATTSGSQEKSDCC